MQMQSFMAQTEMSIAQAFVADKLAVHLVGGVQGPHTLTFGIKLYQPTKANLTKALGLAGAVEAMTSLSPVRIYADRGVICVEVPSPEPVVVDGKCLYGEGLAVPVGMSSRRAIVGVDFLASPHLLLVGPTGQGKTTAARGLAYHLVKQNSADGVQFIVSTFKPKDWKAFGQLANTMAVVTDPAESMAMIDWIRGEMYRRTQAEVDTPHLFVFLDDLLNLLTFAGKEASVMLGEIASLGRGAGIHLIIGTQRSAEAGAGSSIVSGNIPTRLIFGTASAQDAAAFSGRGDSGAEKLGRYKGDALLITEGGTKRVAVAYVSDKDLLALPRRNDGVTVDRPWRNTISTPISGLRNSRNAQNEDRVFDTENEKNTLSDRNVTVSTRLADAPPGEDEQAYLRELYMRLGSKRAVLKAAWGGVVSESGNTPKTFRWLNEALGEN